MQILKTLASATALTIGRVAAQAVNAAVLVATLPDYDSPFITSGFPVDLGVIGTFNFALPAGSTITSATFSGTYGTTTQSASTAGYDAVIEGQRIEVCIPLAAECWQVGSDFRPFAFALDSASWPGLFDGSADLRLIQTNNDVIRLGTPTLTINFRAVPAPATSALLALGLAALMAGRRRHSHS